MAEIGADDTAIFFQEGSMVTAPDGSTFMAHFEYPEVITDFSPANVRDPEIAGRPLIRYADDQAPELNYGDVVVINDVQWKIRSSRKTGDGQIRESELSKP